MIEQYTQPSKDDITELHVHIEKINLLIYADSKLAIHYFNENIPLPGLNGIYSGWDQEHQKKMVVYSYIKSKEEIHQLQEQIKKYAKWIGQCKQQVNGIYDKYLLEDEIIYISPLVDEGATQSIICKKKNEIVLLSTEGKYDYKLLTRVIREIAYRELESAGYVAIHSSAIQLGEKGVLILGDSAVGKTTIALAMCKYKNSKYLSNDKVLVKKVANDTFVATGFSSSARLNYGTLTALKLEKQLSTWEIKNEKPTDNSDWTSFNGKKKLSLLPSELESLLNIFIVGNITIDKIIFPRINPSCNQTNVSRNTDNLDTIKNNVRTPRDDIFPEDWLDIRTKSEAWLEKTAVTAVSGLNRIDHINIEYNFTQYLDVLDELERFICE